jgi:hypothetical protein
LTRSSPTGSDVMSMSEEEPATPISFRRLALDASASPPFSCLCALFIDESPKLQRLRVWTEYSEFGRHVLEINEVTF